ncbi:MAG: HDIG domain-containing protein [Deltaproteobacteria bacterium]|nr:HDIG domain-containing protein [Deltaproteobacteria bacterium]
MNPVDIINKYYKSNSRAYGILIQHGKQVARKALDAAKKVPQLNPDLDFIKEAAMLHDIGMFLTNATELGCKGKNPYICHGYLGREILEKIGLPRHALVCERHVGVGITIEDIKNYALPLPKRDMLPVSTEEQIICFADKFFSKNRDSLKKEKSVEDIKQYLKPYGLDKVKRFQSWVDLFERT